MRKYIFPLLLIIMPLILSCWNSSPTSDKAKTLKVSGVVADKNGTGIGGVAVQINGTNYSSADTTDAAGAFIFKGISSGSYTVKATKESRVFKPSGINIAIASSDIDTLSFIVAENRIHGKVMDIITNKGMADIKITINKNNSPTIASTTTDRHGEYEFFDLPVDDYYINLETNPYINGESSNFNNNVKPEDFADSDISRPDIFMSSEVLQFTRATFSEETNTVELEWTKSRSNFCYGYVVYRTDKLPIGTGSHGFGDFYHTNYLSIEITPRLRAGLNNVKIIHFAVCAAYSYSWLFTCPYSEPVSIKVAE